MRAKLQTGREVGGVLTVKSKDNGGGAELIPVFNANGGSNSINVRSDVPYNFHTHPGVCQSKHSCSFGVPSSQDMRQILEAAVDGNVAHFVVAHEGLYVVQARCSLVAAYRHNKSIGDTTKQKFKNLQDWFSKSSLEYFQFISRWLQFANSDDAGFSVLYYPLHSPLQFELQDQCMY